MSFRDSVLALLDQERYVEAKNFLYNELNENLSTDYSHYLDVAVTLIDLGDESLDADPINKGLQLIQAKSIEIEKIASSDSLNYCLANAYAALYRISRKQISTEIPALDEVTEYLGLAKNHYWKSVKSRSQKQQSFNKQVYVNLGNCLNQSGRIVEAIAWQEYALQIDRQLPQAIAARLDGILCAYRNAKIAPTAFLFIHLIQGFKEILSSDSYPHFVKQTIEQNLKWCEDHSKQFGINSLVNDSLDVHQTSIEFDKINSERKFTLFNHLSLNEHSLYCKCNGTLHDDLVIVHGNLPIKESSSTAEMYFKRICSEYSFARKLYFNSLTKGDFSGESLRVCFRMCFGVLDKIAQGICQFFSLDKSKNEAIYFTSFWKARDKRYEQLNAIKNIHLVGLYSIASDLSKADGEFGFYKEYRNRLEHDVLLISDGGDSVPLEQFKVDTLHLLQLCRAAIFSFAFCVRNELLNEKVVSEHH